MSACEQEIDGKGAPRSPTGGTLIVPMLAAVNEALNYFKFTFSQKVYVPITCYKSQSISSLNFVNVEITFARKFQYLYQKKNLADFNLFFVT